MLKSKIASFFLMLMTFATIIAGVDSYIYSQNYFVEILDDIKTTLSESMTNHEGEIGLTVFLEEVQSIIIGAANDNKFLFEIPLSSFDTRLLDRILDVPGYKEALLLKTNTYIMRNSKNSLRGLLSCSVIRRFIVKLETLTILQRLVVIEPPINDGEIV